MWFWTFIVVWVIFFLAYYSLNSKEISLKSHVLKSFKISILISFIIITIYFNSRINLRKATITDKKLVSEILVSAFSSITENNSINLVVKQDERRIERMHVLMEYLFERAILFGEVYISNNNQACLLLKFTHLEKVTLKTILLDFNLAFKCIGINRVFEVLKRQKIAKQNDPKERHIRPMILGVKKECKGNGTAVRLMLEVKNKFKNNTLPVIIDAASKDNAQLYQKFGFKLTKKEDGLGFPIYFLRMN